MRKLGWILLIMIGMTFLGERTTFAEEIKITIGINDSLLEFQEQSPLIINGTAYSPLEPFINGMQGKTVFNTQHKKYIVTKQEKWITFSIKDKTITTSNGRIYELIELDGIPYIPVRMVGEYFGFTVRYIAPEKIVRVINEDSLLTDVIFIEKHRRVLDEYFNFRPENIVYLTFDDGPNAYTEQILDILKRKEAVATFFMLEGSMKRYPDLVKQMVLEGNYPALHSVTHNKNKLYASPKNVAAEMEKTRKTLLALTGIDSRLTRAPYGSKPYMEQSFRDELVKGQFKMWDWTIDTEDWRHSKDPRKIVERVKSGMNELKGKEKPIVILLHDSKATVSVTGEIIDHIRQQGYELVSYDPTKHEVVNFWNDPRL